MFSFLSYSFAKSAIPVKEKQTHEKQKSKSESLQIAILKQNKLVFVNFRFEKPTDHYIGYLVKYKKERFLFPKNGGKPCKIPIKPRTRNKDNI